jgi:hypothetical protein
MKKLTSDELLKKTKNLLAEERRITVLFNGADLRASEKK